MCYPLYEQGPCNKGHILKFDYASRKPRCVCRDGHMLEEDGNCYPLNTAGPCVQSHCSEGINCYLRNLDTLKTECKCLPGNVTTSDGHCFEPYSRGPCPLGHWLVFNQPGVAVCQRKKQCARYDNWFFWAEDERCYRQYSKGPCPDGRLFYLDISTGEAGCHCRPEWTPISTSKMVSVTSSTQWGLARQENISASTGPPWKVNAIASLLMFWMRRQTVATRDSLRGLAKKESSWLALMMGHSSARARQISRATTGQAPKSATSTSSRALAPWAIPSDLRRTLDGQRVWFGVNTNMFLFLSMCPYYFSLV